jgi:uncharacterized protein DUF5076
MGKGALLVPERIQNAFGALEVLRVWIADGNHHICMRTGVWDDPAAWGLMLADLARHAARALEQEEGRDPAATLSRIIEGLNAELSAPTDEPTGEIIK